MDVITKVVYAFCVLTVQLAFAALAVGGVGMAHGARRATIDVFWSES